MPRPCRSRVWWRRRRHRRRRPRRWALMRRLVLRQRRLAWPPCRPRPRGRSVRSRRSPCTGPPVRPLRSCRRPRSGSACRAICDIGTRWRKRSLRTGPLTRLSPGPSRMLPRRPGGCRSHRACRRRHRRCRGRSPGVEAGASTAMPVCRTGCICTARWWCTARCSSGKAAAWRAMSRSTAGWNWAPAAASKAHWSACRTRCSVPAVASAGR